MIGDVVRKLIQDLDTHVHEDKLGDPFLSSHNYKAYPLSVEYFHPIEAVESGRKLAFIDGGNRELVGAGNFSVQLNRACFNIFAGKKRIQPKSLPQKVEFFSVTFAKFRDDQIFYDTSIFAAAEEFSKFVPDSSDLSFKSSDQYASYPTAILNATYVCGSVGGAIGITESSFGATIQITRSCFWIFCGSWSVNVTLAQTITPTLMVPPASGSSAYAETALGEVNPDGSTTSLYAFVSVLPPGQSGMFSNIPSLSSAAFVILFSQSNYLALLPSSLSSLLSSYTNLVPSTVVVTGYTQNCASSQVMATKGAGELSSELNLPNLVLMGSGSFLTSLTQPSNAASQGCVYMYGSGMGMADYASNVADGLLPAVHQTGLISILESGLKSGSLVPGATPTSAEGTVLILGSASGPLLVKEFGGVFPLLPELIRTSGQINFAVALSNQPNVVHSSSNSHTINFAQVFASNSTIFFANDSWFSAVGVAVPAEGNQPSSSVIPFTTRQEYVVYSSNSTFFKSAFPVSSGSEIIQFPAKGMIEPAGITASFEGVFPANLQVVKALHPLNNGDLLVTVTLKNLDTEPISNIVFDDDTSMRPYGTGISVVSGNPRNASVPILSSGSSIGYSYIVKLAGIGSYVIGPAEVSYAFGGATFRTESNRVVWNEQLPGTASALGILLSGTADLTDYLILRLTGYANLGGFVVYGLVAVLGLVAAAMELKSFRKWLRT